MDDVLGRAWRMDAPWELVTRLAAIPNRMGGHPGEREAADAVGEALAEAGLDPEHRRFETTRWERGDTALAVGDRSFGAVALPYSPAGEVEAPLVDVGHAVPEAFEDADVEDAVVVASTHTPPWRRYVHRMESYGRAVAGGAAAFVFANHRPGQLPPTGSLRFDREGRVPGVGVSAETGDWLRSAAADGGTASLSVTAATRPAESTNVVASLGPDTDETVLVVAHHDAHDVGEGALDNGCGVAVAVGAARLLTELSLERRVTVATVGCEETGLAGSEALAGEREPSVVVNVDGAGRARDLRALVHGAPALGDLAEAAVEPVGHPVHVEAEPHPYSDHWPFLRRGVPALQLHSRPPQGRERGRGWTHTAADSRDKVDRRDLNAHAALAALIVRELARSELPAVDVDALRERLRESGAEPGMRAAGIWPEPWDQPAE